MRIVLDAPLIPGGHHGGGEQFFISLVRSLGQIEDAADDYVIVTPFGGRRWLAPYLGPSQRIVERDHTSELIKRLLGPLRAPLGRLKRSLRTPRPGSMTVPNSNGFFESFGADVIHFPLQNFARCERPTIYNPHDLQHRHYPEFFTADEVARRNLVYGTALRESAAVVAESDYVKSDIVNQFQIDPGKIHVVLRGSPTEFYADVSSELLSHTRAKYRLPESFAFYPARTWPHKNHLGLLDAIGLLRDDYQIKLNLVCTGKKDDHWPKIAKRIEEIDLADQVTFLGFINTDEMRALYHLADFLVFPSLFEGGGFPLMEAFWEGTAVACSDVTSLPEYGGQAALYFDPSSPDDMAQALRRMVLDESLRESLIEKGRQRVASFSWGRTAREYRDLYKKVAFP